MGVCRRNMKFFALIYGLIFTIVFSCKKEEAVTTRNNDNAQVLAKPKDSENVNPQAKRDSINIETPKIPDSASATYTLMAFPKGKKDSAFAVFNKKFTPEERQVILALNRMDAKFKSSADTLVIPNKIDSTMMAYSPFPPQLDFLKEVKKMVIFSYPIQAFGIYTNGVLERWGPTSMGKKKTPTKTGLTFSNWKKELSISTVSDEWKLPYNFNIFNNLGIGWHEYDLPGYPASHSCLRLLRKDAKYLYSYADQWILNKGGATTRAKGTPVLVYGDYSWGKRRPWRNLADDPHANDISAEELEKLISPDLQKILDEQKNREEVILSMPRQTPAKKDSL